MKLMKQSWAVSLVVATAVRRKWPILTAVYDCETYLFQIWIIMN
jgi:hypothetical protein